jgi:hypothetical protein
MNDCGEDLKHHFGSENIIHELIDQQRSVEQNLHDVSIRVPTKKTLSGTLLNKV